MPQYDTLGFLSNEPKLLTAKFIINNAIHQVIIDTGATISCLPEYGQIMKYTKAKCKPASLNVHLANDKIIHINKKISMSVKPIGSNVPSVEVPFYITNEISQILGHEVLLGLNHLRLFNLRIDIRDGNISIYHNNSLIGSETRSEGQYKATVKVDNRFDDLKADDYITTILKQFKRVFTDLDDKEIRGIPMKILTVHQRPIYSKVRHYNKEEILEFKSHIQMLLDKNIIEPTHSGYAATSRIIRKKSGAGRLVVNYIPLNLVTLRDSYSLPNVSDIMNFLQGMKYFSTMDCTQGFYQVDVDIRDRHKTAFSTPIGNYQFRKCPFGARNSCSYFQSEMTRIFGEGLFEKCIVYVDDILIFGQTREQHDSNLRWVLQRCEQNNVKIKLEKCSFAQTEVEYLGFIVSGDSIRPLPNKIDNLSKQNPPKDKTELRSVIGKLNFYSRFIPNYSEKLEPLRELFRKNKDYQWRPFHQEAFESLICSIKSATSQALRPLDEPKIIELHISENSVDALLLSFDEKLINRTSRLMSTAECNYNITERYLLALVSAIRKFRTSLHPDRFKIRVATDELGKCLKLVNIPERVENMLLNMPTGFDSFDIVVSGAPEKVNKKRLRSHVPEEIFYIDGACQRNGKPDCRATWAVCSEYDRDFELKGFVTKNPSNQAAELEAAIQACRHAKQKGLNEITIITDSKYLHSAATNWIDKWQKNDWLDHKKKPVMNMELFKELLNAKEGIQIEWLHVKGHSDTPGNVRVDLIARSLLDEEQAVLSAMISCPTDIQDDDDEIDKIKNEMSMGLHPNYRILDNILYYYDSNLPDNESLRIFVPSKSINYLLKLAHDDPTLGGHLGIKKTYRKLIKFWWPKMYNSVESYVKSCDVCQRFKVPKGIPPGYLHSIPTSKVFGTVHIDIVGPLKPTFRGNTYIITATDSFSKWAYAKPVQSIKTIDVINFLEDCSISIHGKPDIIISDRGAQFTSLEWKQFVDKFNIKHQLTTPYHPQSNGIDERFNGTLVRILRTYVDSSQSDWDEKLKWALYIYNTTVHESTGYSPYQAVHGFDPRSPMKETIDTDSSFDAMKEIRSQLRDEIFRNIKSSQSKQAHYYDLKRKPAQFKIGQFVLTRVNAVSVEIS